MCSDALGAVFTVERERVSIHVYTSERGFKLEKKNLLVVDSAQAH